MAESSVAIVGLGALGSVAAELLARSGVGRLLLFDYDFVELSNLQRQSLYTEEDVGRAKVAAAQQRLRSINSEVSVTPHNKAITQTSIQLLGDVDVLLDCTDNLQTRFLLNEFAMKENIPFIYCGAVETRGMLYVVEPSSKRACFNCIFSQLSSVENCKEFGVINPTTHLAASMQVAEALKVLLGKEYMKELLSFDVWRTRFDLLTVKRNPECAVCTGAYRVLEGESLHIDYCMRAQSIKVRPSREIRIDLERVKELGKVIKTYEGALSMQIESRQVIIRANGYCDFFTKDRDFAEEIVKKIVEMV